MGRKADILTEGLDESKVNDLHMSDDRQTVFSVYSQKALIFCKQGSIKALTTLGEFQSALFRLRTLDSATRDYTLMFGTEEGEAWIADIRGADPTVKLTAAFGSLPLSIAKETSDVHDNFFWEIMVANWQSALVNFNRTVELCDYAIDAHNMRYSVDVGTGDGNLCAINTCIGTAYASVGDWTTAVDHWTEAVAASEHAATSDIIGEALSYFPEAALNLSKMNELNCKNWDSALTFGAWSLERLGDRNLVIQNLGEAQTQFNIALDMYEERESLGSEFNKICDERQRLYGKLATLYSREGLTEEALTSLQEGFALNTLVLERVTTNDIPDWIHTYSFLMNGWVALRKQLGDDTPLLRSVARGWMELCDVKGELELSDFLEKVGKISSEMGEYESAMAAYRRLLMVLEHSPTGDELRQKLARTYESLADLYTAMGECDLARTNRDKLKALRAGS